MFFVGCKSPNPHPSHIFFTKSIVRSSLESELTRQGVKMKIEENIKKYLPLAFFVAVGFLGAHLIGNINLTNPTIARGIVGLAIIYQLVTYGLASEKREPIKSPLSALKDFRGWLEVFIGGGVFYWALQQVFIMIDELL